MDIVNPATLAIEGQLADTTADELDAVLKRVNAAQKAVEADRRHCHAVRRDLERLLAERFELTHTTLQVDHAGGELLEIAPRTTG